MSLPVVIVPYDRRWPDHYEEERRRILEVVGPAVIAVEHIGSTAVPGLGAKPILDIMAAVRRLSDAERCVEPLEALGYVYVPEYNALLPERRYFRKGAPVRTHHLHVVERNSDFWERHLLFREYLRARPEAASEYERLKRGLAERHGADRRRYAEAKSEFVRRLEAQAREWGASRA